MSEELPRGWSAAPIGALFEINPKHDRAIEDSTTISFVPMSSIDEINGCIASSSTRPLGDVRAGYMHFADGDVLFAKITPCMENGNCAIASGLERGLGAGSTEFFVFRSRGAVEPSLLHRFLRQESFRRSAKGEMTGAVGQARVPRTFIEQAMLPVPPLNEQRRIVAKLDALLARSKKAREHLDRIPALLDALKRSVLTAAFRGDLTADWRARRSNVDAAGFRAAVEAGVPLPSGAQRGRKQRRAERSTGAEVDLPEIPPSWLYADVRSLYDSGLIVDFADGNHGSDYPRASDFGADGVRFVTATQVTDSGHVMVDQAPFLSSAKANALRKGWAGPRDVLLTHNATVGRVALVPDGCPSFLLGTSVTFYRTNPGWLDAGYLAAFFISPAWQDQLAQVMEQTTRNQVSIQRQEPLQVAVAPVDEQREISRAVSQMLALIESLRVRAGDLGLLAKGCDEAVLTAAFRGELVSQEPDDERADVMLARLRAATPPPGAKAPRAEPRAKRPAPAGAAPSDAAPSMGDALDVVVGALVAAKRMTAEQVRAATGLGKDAVTPVLKDLVAAGKVRVEGKARGTTYRWTG